jgi:hypothetical protein
MSELANMIQEYIQEVFETQNIVPCDDSIYTHFQQYEPSEHIIEKEIHYFLNSYYLLPDTVIEWEGDLSDIEISRQISVGFDEEGNQDSKASA